MNVALLPELKKKLQHDRQLGPVWTYFLDEFAEKPAFIALGDRTSDPFLEAVIEEIGRQLFGRSAKVAGLLLTRLSAQQFIHGGFFVGGRPGGLIYFEDLRLGLIAIADLPPSIEAKYARFSGQPRPRRGTPSPN